MSEQLIATPSVFGPNGNFLVEREIGSGGMGSVYLGRNKMLDRPVALKVLLQEYAADAAALGRFQKEAQSAARLIHPNIVQVYSYGVFDGKPYMEMELVAGGSLFGIMRNAEPGKTDVTRVLKIGEQIAQALRCAADQGIVHGDVKPENILLDANGNAKLLDFGLAGMQNNTDEIWGTPYYIAPEKVRKEPVDFRADMYSLGGTIYHALTGVAPFEGADVTEVVKKRFGNPPKKPSEIRPGLSPMVDALLMRMLAEKKEDRYPTFEALLADWQAVLSSGLSAPSVTAALRPVARAEAEAPAAKPGGKKMMIRGRRRMMLKKGAKSADDAAENAASETPENPEGEGGEETAAKGPKKRVKFGRLAKRPQGEATDAEFDEEEEESGSIGGKVVLVILIVLAVIGATVGGLVWYKASQKSAAEASTAGQISSGIDKAREAIASTRDVADKFGREFESFSQRATRICEEATGKLKKLLPDFADEMVPPPTKELLDAIASTNVVVEVETPTNAVAAVAAPTNVAAAAAAPTNAAPVASVAPVAPAAPVVEKKKDLTGAVADIQDLWGRAYSCQASAIKVCSGIRKVLAACDAAEEVKGVDRAAMDRLSDISKQVKDMYDEVRNSKDVENVRKAIGLIDKKSEKIIKGTAEKLRIAKLEADRKAKKEAEAKAEAERKAKYAADRKALGEKEIAAANAKFEEIAAGNFFRLLAWQDALRQLNRLREDTKTPEGTFALDAACQRVTSMKNVQDVFIQNMKGYVFTRSKLKRHTVREISEKDLFLVRPDGKTTLRIAWPKFYKDYHGNLNEIINAFVQKGRNRSKFDKGTLTLKPWADTMFGAALTLRLVCSDNPTAVQRGEQLAREALAAMPSYDAKARQTFPDIDFDAQPEAASDKKDAAKDDKPAEEKTDDEKKEEE